MTTDNFTEAARAEAERRWPRDQSDGRPLPANARMNRRIGFDLGAQWAAAQETDGERAVRELHSYENRPVEKWARGYRYAGEHCAHDGEHWPCATIQALDSARAARRDEEKR